MRHFDTGYGTAVYGEPCKKHPDVLRTIFNPHCHKCKKEKVPAIYVQPHQAYLRLEAPKRELRSSSDEEANK